LEERLRFLSKPIAAFQKLVSHAETLTQGAAAGADAVAVEAPAYRSVCSKEPARS